MPPKRTAATELKTSHIADLMRRLEWRRGKTGRDLAREWRVRYDYVRELAAEASRRVLSELDISEVSLDVGSVLRLVIQRAIADDGFARTAARSRGPR